MKYYVYVLYDNEVPFYVGKGTKNRMYEHFRKATKTKLKSPVLNKIRSMIEHGRSISYKKEFETNVETEAFQKEISLIKEIGRRDIQTGPLLNLTDGGEGVQNYSWTDEHKSNLSKAIKLAIKEGRFIPPGNVYERDENYKNNMSSTLKKHWDSEEGKIHKEKMAKERKAKLINGKRFLSDEARKKMSESAKRTNELKKNKHKTL